MSLSLRKIVVSAFAAAVSLGTFAGVVNHIPNGSFENETVVADYSAKYGKIGEKNHTAEFIYFVTDPTGKFIEYACLLAHCFPEKVDRDQYNYDTNSHDATEIEVVLHCTKYESRYINDIAAYYLAIDTLKWSYLDFDPNITQEQIAASDTTFAAQG